MPDTPVSAAETGIQPRPERGLALPQATGRRMRIEQVAYERFTPALPPPLPGWSSYAAQDSVRDLALDQTRSQLWQATWGGVLCWSYRERRCVRHTSDHGLIGNAVRCVAIDGAGSVWAGQNGGLCSLLPDDSDGWRIAEGSLGWAVRHLIPRPQGGIYVALCDPDGRWDLGESVAPEAPLRLWKCNGPATREIMALAVDEAGALWVGNTWGVFRYRDGSNYDEFNLSLDEQGNKTFQVQVRALAAIVGGGLWVGTNWGLYRLDPAQERTHEIISGVPRDTILGLAYEQETDALWVATPRNISLFANDIWQPLDSKLPGVPTALLSAAIDERRRIWIGTEAGLYELRANDFAPAFTPGPDDILCNAVSCLMIDQAGVWMGTPHGLYLLDNTQWDLIEGLEQRDIRALAPAERDDLLWVGTWRGGLCMVDQTVYVPATSPPGPVIALVADGRGQVWAATPEGVYGREDARQRWQQLALDVEGAVVRVLYLQGSILWVGTSCGLFSYDTNSGLPDMTPKPLRKLAINALACDPLSGQLWVGTSMGLVSEHDWQGEEHDWRPQLAGDVRALAWTPTGTLWVGTSNGLQQWPAPDKSEPFTSAKHGMASDVVTALAARTVDGVNELWIGSPTGISCYRYGP